MPTTHSATSLAIDELIAERREQLWSAWLTRIKQRMSTAPEQHPVEPTMERQLRIVLGTLALMAGPLRRSTRDLWFDVCQFYGRSAANRGLATGEVVEEFQYLREVLIRELAEALAGTAQRYLLAVMLRLNAAMDKGLADAVVGYTDQLIITLFAQHGVPVPAPDSDRTEADRQLDQFEAELARISGLNRHET